MVKAQRLVSLILLFILLMLSTSVGYSQSGPTYSDIPYVPDGTPIQVVDIYLPETGVGPFPTILEFHCANCAPGGSRHMRRHLLEQGYALVAVDFNESPSNWAGVKDSFCALAWLHTEGIEYNLDATRTVAFGFSRGGGIVSYLGTVDEPDMVLADCPYMMDDQAPLRGVITIGVGVVLIDVPDNVLSNFTGFSLEEVAAMRESIGQIPANEWADTLTGDELVFASRTVSFWLDGSDPPFLLIHGERDPYIPPSQSMLSAEALEAVGSPVELLVLPDYGHENRVGYANLTSEVELTEAVDAFLEEVFETDDMVEQE